MSWTALCNLLYGQVCCWQCVLSKWPSFQREKTSNSWPSPTPAAPTEVSSQVVLTHYSKNRTQTDKSSSPKQCHWNPAIKDSFGDKRPADLYCASQPFTWGKTHRRVCVPRCGAPWAVIPVDLLAWARDAAACCALLNALCTSDLPSQWPAWWGNAATATQCKVTQKEVKLQGCTCLPAGCLTWGQGGLGLAIRV